MNRYTFTVDVVTDTAEHADIVMVERLGCEEDYGFPYSVSWVATNSANNENESFINTGQRRQMVGGTRYSILAVGEDSVRVLIDGTGFVRTWLPASVLRDRLVLP